MKPILNFLILLLTIAMALFAAKVAVDLSGEVGLGAMGDLFVFTSLVWFWSACINLQLMLKEED